MQKTKLGIPVGILGAVMFFACFFGGYTASILLAGYILLAEENVWLKKAALKGILVMFGFSLIGALISLIPNVISFVDSIFAVFGGNFYLTFVTNILDVIESALAIIEKLLFIALAIKAFSQGTVKVPIIDSIVEGCIE